MSPRQRFEAIEQLPTQSAAERATMLAALYWVNEDGELWPSVENWASLAGVSSRGLRGVLRRLASRGVVVAISDPRGGARRTVRYRVPALAANPESPSGLEPGTHAPTTRNQIPPNPEREYQKPGTGFRRTTKNNQENNHQQGAGVDDVFARLGIEHLRDHANATPERLTWIEREAPSKNDPGAWAASCIRDGWAVPEPTPADAKASNRARIAETLAGFDAMPETKRREVLATARMRFPNLSHVGDDEPAMRGAIAKVLDGASTNRICTTRSNVVG